MRAPALRRRITLTGSSSSPGSSSPSPRVERTTELPDGTVLTVFTVFASRAGVEATLRRLTVVLG